MQERWREVIQKAGHAALAEALSLGTVEVDETSDAVRVPLRTDRAVSAAEKEAVRAALHAALPCAALTVIWTVPTDEQNSPPEESKMLEHPFPGDEDAPPPEDEALLFSTENIANEDVTEKKTGDLPEVRESPIVHIIPAARTAESTDRSHIETKKPPAPPVRPGKQPRPTKPIFGTASRSGKRIPIAELTEATGRCKVIGRVFKVDPRDTYDGKKTIFRFFITDETDSISCKMLISKAEKAAYRAVTSSVVPGAMLEVHGEVYRDKYTGFEDAIDVKGILPAEAPPEREDTAERKRVELHLHSMMSTLDATIDITKAVNTAARWGHSAIAITDHGVVQGYPEFYSACKKAGIQGIFGMEGYLYDDCRPRPLHPDQVFVVFDIETTGFSEKNDHIIEIGAVKLQNGEVIDRFSSFINPCVRLPAKIIELTGIRDDMLVDAEMEHIVLRRFAEFCEGTMLVGHNATGFDMKFILTHAERFDLAFPTDHLDTLTMARALLRDLENHKLNTLVEHLGIGLENHHRAVDDAEATAHLFLRLCKLWEQSGVAAWPVADGDIVQRSRKAQRQNFHFVALVKNSEGLQHLYELVTESHLRHFRRRPRVPRSLLMQLRGGLILGSACSAGELYQQLLSGADDDALRETADFYDYIEVQPISNNAYLIREGAAKNDGALREQNLRLMDIADALGKPCVATSDAHFLHPGEGIYRSVLLASQGFSDADEEVALHFRTTDEMLAEFAYAGAERAEKIIIDNPQAIAAQCEMMPPFPTETCQPTILHAEEQLIETCYQQANEIYGNPLPSIVQARLEHELGSITKYKFSTLYWTARLLVKKSNEDGYLVGSRGSVGSSLVAFLLGITEVNALAPHYVCPKCQFSDFEIDAQQYGTGCDLPERECPHCGTVMRKDGYNIPFETFLGFEGDKVPDIDLNFSGEYQPVAHKYTETLFGKGHVFRAGTISGVQEKTAFGYVLKYNEERNRVVRRAEIERLASGCCGVKRTTGQHPGGIVVVPEDRSIYEFSPLQHPADRSDAGSVTTHFDFSSMHDVLVKLDILGHDDPTMIRSLQDWTGLDPMDIPLDDAKTMSLFSGLDALGVSANELYSEVGTYGIPEFGTNFVRRMLVETRPTSMEELVRISGLSHGTDVWTNNAQELVKADTVTLKEAICTRDDIMTFLITSGMDKKESFTIMESVRKGKGLKDDMIASMKKSHIPDWYIQSCQKIKYMFPRAHAAAYVMMAFRIAYCKVHHPAAYYASYFSVRGDSFDIAEAKVDLGSLQRRIKDIEAQGNKAPNTEKSLQTVLEVVLEMKLRGLDFAPVDVMASDATKFLILDEKTLLPPLDVIAGLGTKAAQSIVEARTDGPFRTQEEIIRRTSAGKSGVEMLRLAGCLEGMQEKDQLSLF